MKHLMRIVCSVGVVVGLSPLARADNTACAGAIFVTPDGGTHTGSFTAVSQDRWFRFVAKANRSYALVTENLTPTDVQNAVGMFTPIGPDCAGAALFAPGNNMTEPVTIDPLNSYGSVRRTMVVAADTEVFFRISGGNGGDFRVRIEETTMFNPAWSTIGVFDTFYSFQNTTNAAVNGNLTLYDLMGAVVDTESATISANGTFSTNTSGMATPRNQGGVAVFTHNGPPGSVLCDASIASFAISPPYIQSVKCQTARQQR